LDFGVVVVFAYYSFIRSINQSNNQLIQYVQEGGQILFTKKRSYGFELCISSLPLDLDMDWIWISLFSLFFIANAGQTSLSEMGGPLVR
jgi:hypothetical protein